MLLPEKIVQNDLPKESKIVCLWAIIELNYRLPYGNLASECLAKILGVQTSQALFFITGVIQGMCGLQPLNKDKLQELCPNYDPEEACRYNAL